MASKKQEYTLTAKAWLENFLKKEYSSEYEIKVVLPRSNISKLPDPEIKLIVPLNVIKAINELIMKDPEYKYQIFNINGIFKSFI